MPQINGYLQIEFIDKEAIGYFYAPKEGGVPLDIKTAEEYVRKHEIINYDVDMFRLAVTSKKDVKMKLGMTKGIEFSESLSIETSPDKMQAIVTFYPGSVKGPKLNTQDILMSLDGAGIKYGIDQEAIAAYLKDRTFFTPVVLARGKEPRHGTDASIEYFFNTNISLKPKKNEDGTVDYHNLDTIAAVNEGDLLARLTPADKGENGYDVCGNTMPCRTVKVLRLEFGKNIRANEERTEIFSEVTGHASLTDGKVFVSNVYEVPADVDNSTGNIDYDGNVHVNGNVRGGFVIQAKGDVVIEGVVEDAMIKCDGQLIVKRGIHGMSKGSFYAGGNVVCQFIENAKVTAGGYIEAGSILHSEVNAAGDVIVSSRKGFINGGTIRAGGKVESQTIGSPMGAQTHIEVGILPEKKERYNQLKKKMLEAKQVVDQLAPIIDKYQAVLRTGQRLEPKHAVYLRDIMKKYQEAKAVLTDDEAEFRELHKMLTISTNSKVVVQKVVHPGVEIVISDVSYNVKKDISFVYFFKHEGEVTFRAL